MKQYLYTRDQLESIPQSSLYTRSYAGTPFSIVGLRCPDDKPGHWGTSVVTIYRDGRLIGGYRRLYSHYGAETFSPFQVDGHWYALYSANYTCTRVLRLHEDSIYDWCGEESSPGGFCPVEFYVPQSFSDGFEDDSGWTFDNDTDFPTFKDFEMEAARGSASIQFPGFAFMAGCVWGDDNAWKLRYIDYSRVARQELVVEERFGYHELPPRPLSQCVDMRHWTRDYPLIHADRRMAFRPERDELIRRKQGGC